MMRTRKTTLQLFQDLPGAIYKARLLKPGQEPGPEEKGTILDLGDKSFWVSVDQGAENDKSAGTFRFLDSLGGITQ
jgi:hypothetical protein